MEEPEKKKIKIELPLEAVDIYEENHEERCEKKCEQSHVDPPDFNRLPYDILRIVFRYLSGMELMLSAAMVCRSWQDAANDEKYLRVLQKNTRLYCFIGQYHIKKKSIDCQPFKQSIIEPSIGFFFVNDYLPFCGNIKDIKDIKDSICELLPKNCKMIMLFAYSLFLNNNVIGPYPRMVGALLPQTLTVKLSMVTVTDTIPEEDRYTEYIQMIEGAARQNHETSMCLMLFCNSYGEFMESHMAQIAYSRFSNNKRIISLCGGVMQKMYINETVSLRESYCVALLITGSIQTWSVILDNMYQTKIIEEKLKLFKEQVKLQKYSVGFMFASVRCKQEGRKNMEATIFKRLFPKVPLVGCYSISEFGRDTTIYKAEFECRRFKHKWLNKLSTTFMILTYST